MFSRPFLPLPSPARTAFRKRLDVRIAAAKDGSLLATRTRKVDSHLAVVAGAVILAHEDVEKRTQTFLEMLGKGQRDTLLLLEVCGSY